MRVSFPGPIFRKSHSNEWLFLCLRNTRTHFDRMLLAKKRTLSWRSVSKKDTLKGWSSIEVKAPVVSGSFMKCLLLSSNCFYAWLGNIRFFKWDFAY